MRIEHIVFLSSGDTPWQYRTTPGSMEGPVEAATEADLVDAVERECQVAIAEYWLRGGDIWVITE